MFAEILKSDPYLVQKHGVKGMKHGVKHAKPTPSIDHYAESIRHMEESSRLFKIKGHSFGTEIGARAANAYPLHDTAYKLHKRAINHPSDINTKAAIRASAKADHASKILYDDDAPQQLPEKYRTSD